MKNLKIYWLLVLLLIVGRQLSAQEKSDSREEIYTYIAANFDKESFLIGTLNDYMGRQQVFTFGRDSSHFKAYLKDYLLNTFFSDSGSFNNEIIQIMRESTKRSSYDQFVDGYFPNEKHLALLVDSLFTGEFSDLRMVDKGCEGRCIKLYSPSLSKIIDGYFEYRPGTGFTVFMDTLYQGYHKAEKLQTVKQKLSFLAGAFLRDGYKTESNEWFLSMPNSISKAEFCSILLKELGCTNVKHDILKDYIPVGHKIYFEPSESVNELIGKIEAINEKFRNFDASHPKLISGIESSAIGLNVSRKTVAGGLVELSASPNENNVMEFSAVAKKLTVDWGDGKTDSYVNTDNETKITHEYADHNPYKIVMTTEDMTEFDFRGDHLTDLDVSRNTALTKLNCSSVYADIMIRGIGGTDATGEGYVFPKKLTVLDVSKNTALTELDCSNNQIIALVVSNNTALTKLHCTCNKLTALDVSRNEALTDLDCSSNQLIALDVSRNTALTALDCRDNQLTALDVSRNTALTALDCKGNQLTALDVNRNTALTGLTCGENQLTVLNVGRNTALTKLNCGGNQLTVLNVGKNTALTTLSCSNNQLSALNVNRNTKLTTLFCTNNQLSALNVSRNTELVWLICDDNHLTALDLSRNKALNILSCRHNKLITSALDNMFTDLPEHSSDNPGLYFIKDNPGVIDCNTSVASAKGWNINTF